jgi:hypothetical protein
MRRLNGRVERLEREFAPKPEDADQEEAYRHAYAEAVRALLSTMAPEHVALLVEECERSQGMLHDRTAAGRLYEAFHHRLVMRIGVAPGWKPQEPHRPLALPRAVAELYLRDIPLLWNLVEHECTLCGYVVPAWYEMEPIICDEAGCWTFQDGSAAPTPGCPEITRDRRIWRVRSRFERCPLCGVAVGRRTWPDGGMSAQSL